ncbi:MAG: HAD family hydrolase [Solirubrobacteraceae bacterium]
MGAVNAIVCDFGGVLTGPIAGVLQPFLDASGATIQQLGLAIVGAAPRIGANPLFELETGRITEAQFLSAIAEQLTEQLGRPVSLDGVGERAFAQLEPNDAMIEYVRGLRARGLKTAICTNNVREWAQRWRAMLPVGELFDVVVDSAFVGARKPEPRIYELTLEQLGVEAGEAMMVDDTEENCAAAVRLGMRAVVFRSTDQAIAEMDALLDGVPL